MAQASRLCRSLLFQYIPDKIMILRKTGQVIVFTTFDSDKRGVGIQQLQPYAVFDRNQPVACAMQDINRTGYFPDPDIGAQMVSQNQCHR